MTVRGYRFGTGIRPIDAPISADGPADGPNLLREYFESHREGPGINKGRHYFDLYTRHLARFVGREVVVVEIGVYSGGSLEMWRRYFGERATIHGIDVQEACRVYEGDRVHIHISDQADRAFWRRFKAEVPFIDVLKHLMTYRTVPLDEPGVASSARRLQQAVEAIHLYPFVPVPEARVGVAAALGRTRPGAPTRVWVRRPSRPADR